MPCKSYLFHPREIAFCGYSKSGKTILISRLISVLGKELKIGYVKHDAHKFEMDHAGKDTFVARSQGAQSVFINDSDHWAIIANGVVPMEALREMYAPLDMVFVEGYKNSPIPKIVLIDEKGEILTAVKNAEISNVLAYAGIHESYAWLDAEYFHRDNIEGVKEHILKWLGLATERSKRYCSNDSC